MRKFLTETLANLGYSILSSQRFEGRHIISKAHADELYTSYKSRFFYIEGMRIHYRDEGMGTPILFLHGFAGSLHYWQEWVDRLVNKYRIITLDLPGFGLSDAPSRDKIDVPNYLNYITALLDMLEVKECHVIGNSFGGWLSWELALVRPKLVKRLVLISAAGYFTNRTKPKTVELSGKPAFMKILKNGVPRFLVKRYLLNSYGKKNKVTEYEINRYYGLINRESNLMSLFKIASQDINVKPKRIRKVKHKTLIMWGTLDRIIPVQDGFQFNKDIKNSRLVVYKGTGHLPHVEESEKSFMDLMWFLEEGE